MSLTLAAASAASDLRASRQEFLFHLPCGLSQWLALQLKDPRDLPLATCLCNVLAYLFVTFAAVCVPSHILGLSHFVILYALFLQRFLLALHYSQHRTIFKQQSPLKLLPGLLTPLFGLPIGSYHAHHCLMHHREDNGFPKDISSTEPYQRDNVIHFLLFVFAVWVELPVYAWTSGNKPLAGRLLLSFLGHWGTAALLWWLNRPAALWLFVIPFMVTSLALMFGNWSQHIFIARESPSDVWTSTYNCIGCSDNQKSFNDGYHILHHLTPGLHWSELPARFAATLQDHGAHKALAFRGIGFFDVGLAVMTGNWEILLQHLLLLSPELDSLGDSDKKALLQSRLCPIMEKKVNFCSSS